MSAEELELAQPGSWNQAERPCIEQKGSVAATVESWAISNPNTIAVAGQGEVLTYGELNSRSSQLAHYLASLGAGPGRLVVIALPRSAELIIAALAILKTGAAYVPLDPAWPGDRLQFMLSDSGAGILVSKWNVGRHWSKADSQFVDLDRDADQINGHPTSFSDVAVQMDDLAYVIYTSGSTGHPKGVQITHGGLSNLVSWHQQTFAIGPSDRASMLASPGFDASVWEVWPYLCAGSSVHIADERLRNDPEGLRDWLVGRGVTVSFVSTGLAELMMVLKWPTSTALRTLLTGADTLHRFPPEGLPFTVVNNYGPTECTVVATSGVVPVEDTGNHQPTIGRPISGTQVFIVDEQLKLVPAGVIGEMLVGGKGVARGYLNRPALTAEKFITNQFAAGRLYRTGDLARYLPDGQIAFMGRCDDQLKIRGYRIEPGEVIARLNRHPDVLTSHVTARGEGTTEKTLVAYIVPRPGSQLEHSELRSFLLADLPEFMVPGVFVLLDAMPYTSNGKVDRAALPAPDDSNILRDEIVVAAQNPVEERVASIVGTLLGLQQVGSNDNFFLLGGHSLLAAQVIARIREAFDVDVSLRTLFETPTVAQLSAEIERLLVLKLETMNEEEAQRRLDALAS